MPEVLEVPEVLVLEVPGVLVLEVPEVLVLEVPGVLVLEVPEVLVFQGAVEALGLQGSGSFHRPLDAGRRDGRYLPESSFTSCGWL